MKYGGNDGTQYGGSGAGGGNSFDAATEGVPEVLARWGVPVILASSGTMGNNGAVSGMTALPTTYSGGAWLYLPANAIQAGSAAGFYWFVASSTTAGTVYNSTFDGASIPAAGTTTAFVSTGPGAFTGIAAGEILVATIAVPAGAMGPNGKLELDLPLQFNTAAGNKIFRVDLGGTDLYITTLSTSASGRVMVVIRNLGVANRQSGTGHAGASASLSYLYGSLDSTGALSLTITAEKATATNHAIYEGGSVQLVYGA